MTQIDYAAVMAEHEGHHVSHLPDDDLDCCSCSQPGHICCLSYRLAKAASDLAGSLAAITYEAERGVLDLGGGDLIGLPSITRPEQLIWWIREQARVARLSVAVAWDEGARAATMDYGTGKAENPYRAALADQPEQN